MAVTLSRTSPGLAADTGSVSLKPSAGPPQTAFSAMYTPGSPGGGCQTGSDVTYDWDGYPGGPQQPDYTFLQQQPYTGSPCEPQTVNGLVPPNTASCLDTHTLYAFFTDGTGNVPPEFGTPVPQAAYTLQCVPNLVLDASSGPTTQPATGTYTLGGCTPNDTVDFVWNGTVQGTGTLSTNCSTGDTTVGPGTASCGTTYSVVAYDPAGQKQSSSNAMPYTVTCPPTPTPAPTSSSTTASTTTSTSASTSATTSQTSTHTSTHTSTSTRTTRTSSTPAAPTPPPTTGPVALATTPSPSPTAESTSSPTPTPTPVPTVAASGPTTPSSGNGGPTRSTFVRSVIDPRDISSDPGRIGIDILIALALILVIVFPCELFNGTLEENYDEIRGWFGKPFGALRSARAHLPPAPGWLIYPFFAVIMAALYGLLDPKFGFDETSLCLFLGLLAGLVVVTVGFDLPSILHVRLLRGERVELTPYAGTLIVAGVCVLISRLAHFQPGYLYGLVAGFTFGGRLNRRDEGRALAISAASVFLLSLAAYVLWLPVKDAAEQPNPAVLALVGDAMLATVFVAGLETAMFGLIPVRFLDGAKVIAWDRRGWALLMGLGAFGFVHVLLDPRAGLVGWRDDTSALTVLALFAGFGLVSVAFWGYFRIHNRGEEGEGHTPEGPAPPAGPDLLPTPPGAPA